MPKVVALMSMSLDGYVADLKGGVAEVFDWYFASGDVEFHTGGSDPMTFKVSGPSAQHLRDLRSDLGAVPPAGALSTKHTAGTETTRGGRHSSLPTISPLDGRDPTRRSTS